MIGLRPAGDWSRRVRSRSPYMVRAKVLGMGVAVMERRCGAGDVLVVFGAIVVGI